MNKPYEHIKTFPFLSDEFASTFGSSSRRLELEIYFQPISSFIGLGPDGKNMLEK